MAFPPRFHLTYFISNGILGWIEMDTYAQTIIYYPIFSFNIGLFACMTLITHLLWIMTTKHHENMSISVSWFKSEIFSNPAGVKHQNLTE